MRRIFYGISIAVANRSFDPTLFCEMFRLDSVAAEVGEHFDEVRMVSDGAGADELQAVTFSGVAGFVVEVV